MPLLTEVFSMTDLSPAAQAVLDAATPALNNLDACGFNHQRYDRKALAAALRAAADQLAQVPIVIGEPLKGNIAKDAAVVHVADLFAIATELENHQ